MDAAGDTMIVKATSAGLGGDDLALLWGQMMAVNDILITEDTEEVRAFEDMSRQIPSLERYGVIRVEHQEVTQLARETIQTFNEYVQQKQEANEHMEAVDKEMALLNDALSALETSASQEMGAAITGVEATERGSRNTTLALTLAAIAIGVTFGWYLTRAITGPISRCVEFAEVIAGGDLSGSVDIQTKDETRQLGDALGSMADKLRQMIAEITQASTEVASSSDEISAATVQISKGAENQATSSDETSSTMVEMASQIDSVATSAQSLASNADETSSSIQEMSASIEQVASNADGLLSSVEETSTTIEQMAATIGAAADKVKVVDEVSKDAARIAKEGGEELSGVIDGIGTSSQSIGKIVKIIEDIADQTNLLALNAAIEAARAGDAGKGFAVVAEEVNRLAERSMKSTSEISSYVEAVQTDTNQAVEISGKILNQISESVAKTSELVSEVYASTQEQSAGAAQILKTATHMQDTTREVASAAKQQATGAIDVSKAVAGMTQMTQQVADATLEQKKGGDQVVKAVEQIAAVARQNSASTDQLAATTQRLANEAERLQGLANRFTV